MNTETMEALRRPFPPEEVGKLPRITCAKCSKADTRVCPEHSKSTCQVCGNYITVRHMHLDYVGHAELTDRLLEVDPEWSWEPAAWGEDGSPVITKHAANLVMWGRLTLGGVTRLGVGTAAAGKDDAHKELIGDFLRNAAMRFGVALDLWRKTDRAESDLNTAEEHGSDVPTISADNAKAMRAKCDAAGVNVADVVQRATDKRTSVPEELLRSEVPAAKKALDDLAKLLAKQAS